MTHDLATWTAAGYKATVPTLSGNETTQITQYFDDEVATCGVSPTVGGCATSITMSRRRGRWAALDLILCKVAGAKQLSK